MSISNLHSDRINSLFLSYQDLQTDVRKLQNEVEVKKGTKITKEKELISSETKFRESDNELFVEKNNLVKTEDYNKALKRQAEKERVEQYAVYMELISAEEATKSVDKQRQENQTKYTEELRQMVIEQFKMRESYKKSLPPFGLKGKAASTAGDQPMIVEE